MEDEKRLIDANALQLEPDPWGGMNGVLILGRSGGKTMATVQTALKRMIENAPTVDAVEVVHGQWELHGNDDDCGCSYFCSNCHNSYDEDWFYVHGQYRHWNYCPNCGADMRERKDNEA